MLTLVGCTPAPSAPPTPPRPATTPSPPPQSAAAPAPAGRRPTCDSPCRRKPRIVGRFDVAAAPEASGIAASARTPGVLYVVDDGPGTTAVLALRARSGRIIGRLEVAGLAGTDTEGLAVGRCDAGSRSSCLYIGDIGDNTASRGGISVIRVREPSLEGPPSAVPLPADSVTWRYPDAPVDAEALLALPDHTLAIVSKDPGKSGRGGARLYVAPGFTDATLEDAGRVRLPRPSLPLASVITGNVVTGGDAVPGRVVLRTYDAIYEFTTPAADADPRGFPRWPVEEVDSPPESQGEAVTYAADGCGLFTVSEGSGALTAIACR